jgi:hypothetical protein
MTITESWTRLAHSASLRDVASVFHFPARGHKIKTAGLHNLARCKDGAKNHHPA